jgi:hypothetical protein
MSDIAKVSPDQMLLDPLHRAEVRSAVLTMRARGFFERCRVATPLLVVKSK